MFMFKGTIINILFNNELQENSVVMQVHCLQPTGNYTEDFSVLRLFVLGFFTSLSLLP